MNLASKKTALIILGITSLLCSRASFFFINDPEGPNLLIVIVLAAILYFVSVFMYLFGPSSTSFKKLLLAIFTQIVVVLGIFFVLNNLPGEKQMPIAPDYKNIPYSIDGENVALVNGVAETEAAPGSASKIKTEYFGSELQTDLNGDGREDIVFLLTQETGGSGTMFYVVAALNTERGYVGSDGYFLGDRIAPQNIVLSPNPRHKNVIVVNYADRKAGEPMSSQPTVGKSAYLKLDPATMQWGIVEPDFEGESR